MTLKATDGLEVPLHRSLVEPMMVVGLPRTVALVLWTTVCAFAFGLRQIWVLARWVSRSTSFASPRPRRTPTSSKSSRWR